MNRLNELRTIAFWAIVALFLKVLVAILLEYRWYFPANFELSAFLSGREATFHGLYQAAFYTHIIFSPPVILLGCWLMFSGQRKPYRQLHRRLGRLQMMVVLGAVVPSGFVMSLQAYAGPIAAWGFAMSAVVTGWCGVMAIQAARARKFAIHKRWATRCFVMLCSPLLLRVFAGAVIVTNLESEWTYRLNAWASWLIPMALYEIGWRRGWSRTLVPPHLPVTTKQEALT